MRLFLLIICFLITANSYAKFETYTFSHNRTAQINIPDNFNGTIIVIPHGATPLGTKNLYSQNILIDPTSLSFVNKSLDKGIGIVLPNSRPGFGEPYFETRWETENDNNPDIDFISELVNDGKNNYNKVTTKSKAIKKVVCMGGSSGGLLCSRLVTTKLNLFAGIVLINAVNSSYVNIDSNDIIQYDVSYKIPYYHPPLYLVSSTNDRFNSYVKKRYVDELRIQDIPAFYKEIEGGEHAWSSWALSEHDNILSFIQGL